MATKTRRVLVTNIPVFAYEEGWVTIPLGASTEDKLNREIAKAILANGYERTAGPSGAEVEDGYIKNGWDFAVEPHPCSLCGGQCPDGAHHAGD